ncbi:hypothetical protein D3877_16265 [Azospirillum cavernae]|uniref:Uncharacterized protein n=1 Tax=Azospirillum cavernae TaxID=2320860 RepID=A0A418VX21_9PROT|nr:hypothetical protein [Azospirillum cavernae]RJF81675.1 hypothetical protein D3877_16265 [Azospirillum cavernae]
MRHTHPNPLRTEAEAHHRRGAKSMSEDVAQALASGFPVRVITAEDVRDNAPPTAWAKSIRTRARRGAEAAAARKREAARREAARS